MTEALALLTLKKSGCPAGSGRVGLLVADTKRSLCGVLMDEAACAEARLYKACETINISCRNYYAGKTESSQE